MSRTIMVLSLTSLSVALIGPSDLRPLLCENSPYTSRWSTKTNGSSSRLDKTHVFPYPRGHRETSADYYCTSRLTQNTTVPKAGISPKRVPTVLRLPLCQLQPEESKTDSSHAFFTWLKIPKSEQKVASIRTRIQ